MCLPALAFVGTALGASTASAAAVGTVATAAVAAGGVAAYGAYQQGQSQKNLMNYQRDATISQSKQEADIAKANISGVQTQAAMESQRLSRSQSEVKGQQTAAAGAQGIGSSGTAADIAKSTFTKQQMDQMTLQYNANVKSWDITNRANQRIWALQSGASQYGMGAKNSEEAGYLNAGSSLLSTASQIGTLGIYASS